MFLFRDTVGPVTVAFTDRHDGVSGPPFDSLNLAIEGRDDPGSRSENLRLVVEELAPGAGVVGLRQVHGARVITADGPTGPELPEADGVVTRERDLVLAVRVADCVPVLLADPEAGVVGAVHCGRKGLTAGVVPAAVARMRDQGSRRVLGWIGPHVCGGCYEVPEEMRAEVVAAVPESRSTSTWGTPALDLGAGVRAQLAALFRELCERSGELARVLALRHAFERRGAEAAAAG